MAATLLLIKSRILLPKRRQEEDGADEDPGRSWPGRWKNSGG